MAVIKRGILGGFSGKVGNVCGTSWKGIAVMKSMPLSVANPNTVGQQKQRGKMSTLVNIGSSVLSSVIQPIWNASASQMSGYNYWIQSNISTAFNVDGVLIPNDLVFSPTILNPSPVDNFTADVSDAEIAFTQANIAGTGSALATDVRHVVLTDSDGNVLLSESSLGDRTTTSITVSPIVGLVADTTVHLFVFFVSADGKRIFGQATSQCVVTA